MRDREHTSCRDEKEETQKKTGGELSQPDGRGEKADQGEENFSADFVIWCTSCGRPLPEESVYCEFCGEKIERELEEETKDAADEPEGKKTGKLFLNAAGKKKLAVFLTAAACGVILLLIAPGKETEGSQSFSGYIKDNSLFAIDGDGAAEELTDYYLSDWKRREETRLPYDNSCAPVITADGTQIWYPEEIGDSSFTLMHYNKKKQEKIDSGVVSFQAAGSTAVYEKNNTGLYVSRGEGRDKLSAGVAFYQLSEDGSSVIWEEENADGTRELFYRQLDGGDAENVRLEREDTLLDVSDDLSSILYEKDGDVWLLLGGKEKERLVQNTSQLFLPEAESKTLFFTREEGEGESLYFLDENGEENLLDREFLFLIHGEDGLLTYKAVSDSGEEVRIATQYGSAAVDCGQETPIAEERGYAWYTAEPEPGVPLSLYRVSLEPDSFGRTEEIAQAVEAWCGLLGETPLYLRDGSEEAGDLYLGEERAAYDVKMDSVTLDSAQTKAYCIAQYDAEARSGVLLEVTEGGTRQIGEDVSGYGYTSDGQIFYFTDYEPQRGRAALNLYDRESQKTEQIDTDVWAYYAESADGRERGAVRQTEIR